MSRLIECTTPKANHYANYGLYVIMMCQCRFISHNKCTTMVRDVDNRGGYACVAAEGIWEISGPSLQCCYEPKTALKHKVLILKIDIYNREMITFIQS